MAITNKKARLVLSDRFRLENSDGREIRISSRKSQALLILLATTENGIRDRRWIERLLWSNREPRKQSDSLGSELCILKGKLKDHEISLTSDRQEVQVDLATIEIDLDVDDKFLEAFSIKDRGFMGWLDGERARRSGKKPEKTPIHRPLSGESAWRVNFELENAAGLAGWFASTFASMAAQSLRETQNTPISLQADEEPSDRLLTIAINVGQIEKMACLSVSIERRWSNMQIWSGHRTLPLDIGAPPLEHPDCLSLVYEIVGAVDQYLYRNSWDIGLDEPDRLYHQAVRDLFSMQPDRIAAADSLLEKAYQLSERGLFLALRAQLKTIQRVEQLTDDTSGLLEQAEALSAKAHELEPDNSMVLALLANTASHLMRDHERSLELALQSVDINKANPMAWWALSSSSMYLGRHKDALRCALHGQNLSARSQFKFWWDQQSFGAAFAIGKYEEAFKLMKSAHAQNRIFRPPLRYLLVLNAHFGFLDEAAKCAEKLRELEPDFSVERLLDDRDYPASLIHSAPGLNVEQLRALC